MTFEEFGALVKKSPEVQQHYTQEELARMPDRILALKTLEKFPDYWDMISPVAKRIYELQHESTTPQYYFPFLKTNKTVNADRWDKINTISQEVSQLHNMSQILEAEQRGVNLDTLNQMKLLEHQHEMQARQCALEREHLLETARVEDEIQQRRLAANQQRSLPASFGKAKRKTASANKPAQLDPEDDSGLRDQEGQADPARVRRPRQRRSAV